MMKRFFFTIILMALLVVTIEPARLLLSKFLHLEQPATHQIQNNEWLSKIALKYYGDVSYWKELALINRAPDGNLVFPGEEIILPSFEAIQRVRQSHSLSSVNDIVGEQQNILAGRVDTRSGTVAERNEKGPSVEQPAQTRPETKDRSPVAGKVQRAEPEQNEFSVNSNTEANTSEDSFFLSTPVLTGIIILAVILAVGIFMYVRNKRRDEEVTLYGENNLHGYDDEESENGSKNRKRKEAVLER